MVMVRSTITGAIVCGPLALRRRCRVTTPSLPNPAPRVEDPEGSRGKMRLFVIGEAAKAVSESFRLRSPAVDWKNMIRLRDRLGHHYWSIELDKIWEIVVDYVPVLLAALREDPILKE